ncbi:MAG: hypothetical protein E6183_03965 [Veillonella sp.]|nr:hypothetical protein [Veillonella sp.]
MTAEWLKSLLEKVDDDYEIKILDFRSELELDISNVRIDLFPLYWQLLIITNY